MLKDVSLGVDLAFDSWLGSMRKQREVFRRINLLVLCFLLVVCPYLCVAGGADRNQKIGCILNNQTSCPENHCCVKQVITFKDPSKSTIANTVCQPLLTEGAMCLRNPEGYMCNCAPGLKCSMADYQTFGYCRRSR